MERPYEELVGENAELREQLAERDSRIAALEAANAALSARVGEPVAGSPPF